MAEKNIELDSVEIAAAVFGNCDRNIRLLENEFSVTAVCRGTQLRLSGEPSNVAAASRAVEGMLLLIENHTPLEDQTVRYCISLAHDGAEPEGIPECHPEQCHHLWCWPGGHR